LQIARQFAFAGQANVGTISPQSRCDFAPSMAQNADEIFVLINEYMFALYAKKWKHI
jgi:hypothetical protein